MIRTPKIFAGRSNDPLAKEISSYTGIPLSEMVVETFADGEISVKIEENIRGANVFVVQSTNPPAEHLLELLIISDAMRRASAHSITAMIPYFGYARQDRKSRGREPITAKLVADLITTSGIHRVVCMDLHTSQLQGFFDIPVDHLYAASIFNRYFLKLGLKNLTVAAPDIGRATLARAYARRLGADIAIIEKNRPHANISEIMNVIGDVKDSNVLIMDDICDTAGTLVRAASALKDKGAEEIYAGCSHALFSGNALEKIDNSPIKEMVVTNTINQTHRDLPDKIKVLSVAEVLGEAIQRIHGERSISEMFAELGT